MTNQLPIYISDPVGERYRSAADHAFVTANMHRPILRRLAQHGLRGEKFDVEALDVSLPSLEGFGGLILLGGWDIDRMFYARDSHTSGYGFNDVDAYELDLLYEAHQRNLPVLGICRGEQLINVFYGGTLHGDIGHLSKVRHNNFGAQAYGRRATVHGVTVAGSSALREGNYRVASSHHQAVDRLGEDLVVTGVGEDNIVEMIEHKDLPIVGVQWHPESAHVAQTDTLTPLIANFAKHVTAPTAPMRTPRLREPVYHTPMWQTGNVWDVSSKAPELEPMW